MSAVVLTAAVAGTVGTMIVARNTSTTLATRDTLLVFGGLVVLGTLLGGVEKSDGPGRGLLWAAGGVAAASGINKALW